MNDMLVGFESGAARALESRHLFRFDPASGAVVDEFVTTAGGTETATDPAELTRIGEFVSLAAAEFALLDAVGTQTPGTAPVTVSAAQARRGLLKYNCTIILGCRLLDPDHFGANEMTVFSSDASRIETVGMTWDAIRESPDNLHELVRRLDEAHRNHPSFLVRSVGQSGVVRIQGLLWRMRLTLAGFDSYRGPLDEALRASMAALDIGDVG